MTIYDWDEIKRAGDCVRFASEVLGAAVSNDGRCAAVWRGGSNENSVALEREQWYDHAEKVGGSIIDLCAVAKFNGDTFAAAEFLGQWLGISPKTRLKPSSEIVATYDYTDGDGNLVIQVVRYKPKDFRQRRPDPAKPGEWLWSVKGITPPLYRLFDLRNSPWTCIVGGEKDTDNLRAIGIPATCNAGGEGNWLDAYNAEFKDKFVVIIADKDEAGRKHAQIVSFALKPYAKNIRVLELPDRNGPVKDASDWIAAGGTKDELVALIKATPLLGSVEKPRETQDEISAAKKANAKPFSNYDWVDGEDDQGKPKPVKQPRKISAMLEDLHTRFWNFPCRIGGQLFDHDRKTGRIRILRDARSLSAWIQEKSGHQLDWAKRVEGCASMEEFFETVMAGARQFEMISGVPNSPTRDDVYYTHGELPKPDPSAAAFTKLCSFFHPATKLDAALIRVMFASPLYYRHNVHRPMWIIDSATGQGAGKTTLCDMLAYLYGTDAVSSAIRIDQTEITNPLQYERVLRRMLSESGRQVRVAVIDNVVGHFKSHQLASLLTSPSISGMAPYGRGEERRPSDITYCMTANTATIDRDLAERALFINVNAPAERDPLWITKITNFIRENRLQIMADIMGIMQNCTVQAATASRCPQWERDVMIPLVGSAALHSEIWKEMYRRRQAADTTSEEAEILRAYFAQQLQSLALDPTNKDLAVWIPSSVISEWARGAIPGFGGTHGRGAPQAIRNMVKVGLIPELSDELEKFPVSSPNRTRGLMWNLDARKEGRPVHVLEVRNGTVWDARIES